MIYFYRYSMSAIFAILFFSVSCPFIFIFYILENLFLSLSVIPFLTIFLTAFFVSKSSDEKSIFISLINGIFALLFYSLQLGQNFGVEYIFIPFSTFSILLLNKNRSWISYFFSFLCIVSFYFVNFFNKSIQNPIFIMMTLASFIMAISIVDIYRKISLNHIKEIAEKTKHETEIKLGKKIQKSYLTTIPPHYEAHPTIYFNTYYKGAKQVSGDYYTAHLLDKHRLRFVILDINGKGIEAAFTMIHAHTIIEPYICSDMPPHECLAHINNDLLKMPVKKTSCDLFFGELDLETRTLTYANASLEVAYVIKQNKQVVCLNMSGLKTGMFEDETYVSSTIRLEKGDTLLFATDGLIDMLDKTRPEGTKSHKYAYTGNRLKQFLASKTWELGGLKEMLVTEIDQFEGDLPQIDDTTFLTIEFG